MHHIQPCSNVPEVQLCNRPKLNVMRPRLTMQPSETQSRTLPQHTGRDCPLQLPLPSTHTLTVQLSLVRETTSSCKDGGCGSESEGRSRNIPHSDKWTAMTHTYAHVQSFHHLSPGCTLQSVSHKSAELKRQRIA